MAPKVADAFNNAIINIRQSFYLEGKLFTEQEAKIIKDIIDKEDYFFNQDKDDYEGF